MADVASHIPVLLEEVVEAVQPAQGKRMADGTYGAGGYTLALLSGGAESEAMDEAEAVRREVGALAGAL